MKENRISIVIHKPVQEVFEFIINPNNTPLCIKHLKKEEASDYPPKLGTTYKNRGESDIWDEYKE